MASLLLSERSTGLLLLAVAVHTLFEEYARRASCVKEGVEGGAERGTEFFNSGDPAPCVGTWQVLRPCRGECFSRLLEDRFFLS